MTQLPSLNADIRLTPATIIFNNAEEILRGAERLNEELMKVVVTDETIKTSKGLVAEVRKRANEIDRFRIDLKKEILEPYNEFAEKVKEIVATVEGGEDIIRKQVRELEEKEREEKHDYLFDMIGKRIRHYPLVSKYEFNVESFIERSYLNKSTSLDKAEKEILLSLEKAESDLELLTDMEHGSEMIIEYVSNRDVTLSISEVKARHRRLEEMKEKVEEVTNTSQLKGVVNTNVQQTENVGKQSGSDERNEYVVKVYSNDDYIKLLEYMASQGIRWEKV